MEQLSKGDFVWYTCETNEVFPGRIVNVEKDIYSVEICLNKKKSSNNELEVVKAKKEQLEIRILGL